MTAKAIQAAGIAWDELDRAIQRTLVAQPSNMTACAKELETARILMATRFKQLLMAILQGESK